MATDRPNILFLMTDQMQGRVLDPQHPCRTPAFDRLAERGMRFDRAYTTNPVCSPARASLMTGLLPHSHGVLAVTHTIDPDLANLRADRPHFAQRLLEAGYQTAYFGKWHVERTGQLDRYGWQTFADRGSDLFKQHAPPPPAGKHPNLVEKWIEGPPGYKRQLLYAVTPRPAEHRAVGHTTTVAEQHLRKMIDAGGPWCCFVSVTDPHDPFVCSEETYAGYDVDNIELPANVHDTLENRPGLYRKSARVFAGMTDTEHRQARACYWGAITDVDQQYDRLLRLLEERGQLDNTIIILASDHGEALGAHGVYQKNIGAWEDTYNIPLVIAGPGVKQGLSSARVGIHDIAPTLLELCGLEGIGAPDSRSFAEVVRGGSSVGFDSGYAEYYGTRYWLNQRVIWQGPWKLVWNGFDFDELYNLDEDPQEMTNRIDDAACRDQLEQLMRFAWQRVRETGDHALLNAGYASLRLAAIGPEIDA